MEDSEGKQGFKISDRRRFDSSGNEIDSAESQPAAKPAPEKPRPAAAQPNSAQHMSAQDSGAQHASARHPEDGRGAAKPSPDPVRSVPGDMGSMGDGEAEAMHGADEPEEGISFHSFIMSLAHQALMLLGEIPGPDGRPFPSDKVAAQQTIDILSMLEHKTRGNLNPEEKHFLEEILHELRLRFVRG
jgi:hypothetical protein